MNTNFFRVGLAAFFVLFAQTALAQSFGNRVAVFGQSCTPAMIGSVGVPDTGETINITLTGAPANSFAFLFIGFSDTSYNGYSLPMDFTPFGAPGCSLNVAPEVTFTAITDAQGNASIPIQIPSGAHYDGLQFYGQWLIHQPGANPFGFTFSSGIRVMVRAPVVIKDTIGATTNYTDNLYGIYSIHLPSVGTRVITPGLASVTTPSILKSMRVVGYRTQSSDVSCLDYRLRVWSSLNAAIASPLQGDVADIFYGDPTSGPTPFGVGPAQSADGLTYEMKFDALPGNVQLQQNGTYAFTITAIRNGGCSWWKNSESNMLQGPSDTVILNSGPTLATNYIGITTGVFAMEIVTTPQQ